MKVIKLFFAFIILLAGQQVFAQEIEGKWQITDMELLINGISEEEKSMILEAYGFDQWMGDILELNANGTYLLKDKFENDIQEGAWQLSGTAFYTSDYLEQVQIQWDSEKLICPVALPNVDGKKATLNLTFSPFN